MTDPFEREALRRLELAFFIVDLATCTGCHACAVACKDRASLPDEVDYLRVREEAGGHFPDTELAFRPSHCFHCADAPCAEACPVEAISRGEEGFWEVDEDACTGCGACADACPFDAVAQRDDGTACKCDGCADELAQGWEPTCVCACPMRALDYGPFDPADWPGREPDPTWDAHGSEPRVVFLRRPSA